MSSTHPTFTLTPIAATGERFSDFSHYVASIADDGTVAFQAALHSGGTGVFTGSGGSVATAAQSHECIVSKFYSHPAISADGTLSVYGELAGGGEGVVFVKDGEARVLSDVVVPLSHVGPLGPTMNDSGEVAFRGDTAASGAGVFVRRGDSFVTVADSGHFAGFRGLPVINGRGTVVFRADLKGGGQGIYAHRGASVETVMITGGQFRELGFFPSLSDSGTVAFAAHLSAGGAGVFTIDDGTLTTVADTDSHFESFRGISINDTGATFFYGTPRGGHIGVYDGANPTGPAIVSIGDDLLNSRIAEFALNPVSLNSAGQLALRIRLEDDRQLIVRADPTA